MRSLDDPFTLV